MLLRCLSVVRRRNNIEKYLTRNLTFLSRDWIFPFFGYLESVGKIRKCLFDSISNAMGKKLLTYSLGIPLLLGISLTLPRVGVWIFYGTTQFQFRHKAKNSMRIYRDGKTVLFFNPGKTQISTRKFSEVKKHIRYACSRSFFRQG